MRTRKWLATVLALGLTLGLLSQAVLAAPPPVASLTAEEAVDYLKHFGIIQGDPDGNMRLGDAITRAEAAKVLVVATGHGARAELLAGAQTFPDVAASHWASGYVAVAKEQGLIQGYQDGTFRPNNNVTNAEIIALITRAAGVAPDGTKPWPAQVLDPAVAAGIVPDGVNIALVANAAATRGGVFLLAHRGFFLVTDGQGENLYQRVFTPAPPALAIDPLPDSTANTSVVVSGTATEAVAAFVDGERVALRPGGHFSHAVTLNPGPNEITVMATGMAGNTVTQPVNISLGSGKVASISASASLGLKAGEVRMLDIQVLDEFQVPVPDARLEATVQGDVGTFDPATRVFTAGAKTGSGTLTLSVGTISRTVSVTVGTGAVAKVQVVAEKLHVAPGELLQLRAKAFDAYGNETTGLPVLYRVSGDGAFIGEQNGQFIGSRAGKYTITATMGTVSGTIEIGVFGGISGLKIDGPKQVVGNGKGTAFTVAAIDRSGTVVGDSTLDISLETTAGVLVDENGRGLSAVTLKAGSATFYIQADEYDWGMPGEIKAEAFGDDDDYQAKLAFNVIEQRAAGIAIAEQDEYLAANDSSGEARIRAHVVDQDGREMLDGAWDIDWSITGDAVEKDSGDRAGTLFYRGGSGGETLILQSRRGLTGDVEVVFSSRGLDSATAKLRATLVRDANKLKVTTNRFTQAITEPGATPNFVEVTVTVTDDVGVPARYRGDIFLEFSRRTSEIEPDDGDCDCVDPERIRLEFDGVARRTVRVAYEQSGEVTARATSSGLSSGSAVFTVKAGTPDYAEFVRPAGLTAMGDGSGRATIQIYDTNDNPVNQAGVKVRVKAVDDDIRLGGRREAVYSTDANGVIFVEYTLRGATERQMLQISGGGSELPGGQNNNYTVYPSIMLPTKIDIKFYDVDEGRVATRAAAGNEVEIRAYLSDRYGAIRADRLDVQLEDFLSVEVDDGFWMTDPAGTKAEPAGEIRHRAFGPAQQDGSEWYYPLSLYGVQAGRARVKVNIDVGREVIDREVTFNITAGDPEYAVIAEAEIIDEGKGALRLGTANTRYTLRLVDKFLNPVTSVNQRTQITLNYGDGNLSAFRNPNDAWPIDESFEITTSSYLYFALRRGVHEAALTITGDRLSAWEVTIKDR